MSKQGGGLPNLKLSCGILPLAQVRKEPFSALSVFRPAEDDRINIVRRDQAFGNFCVTFFEPYFRLPFAAGRNRNEPLGASHASLRQEVCGTILFGGGQQKIGFQVGPIEAYAGVFKEIEQKVRLAVDRRRRRRDRPYE